MSRSYLSHLRNKWRYLPVNIFCCLQHNTAWIIDAARLVGAINLERNGLYAGFSINQHLRVGKNIVELQHGDQENVLRLKSWQVLVENQDRLLDDLSCLVRSGTGWIGVLVQPATCVIVVQITVNTSSPPGSEGLRDAQGIFLGGAGSRKRAGPLWQERMQRRQMGRNLNTKLILHEQTVKSAGACQLG